MSKPWYAARSGVTAQDVYIGACGFFYVIPHYVLLFRRHIQQIWNNNTSQRRLTPTHNHLKQWNYFAMNNWPAICRTFQAEYHTALIPYKTLHVVRALYMTKFLYVLIR